MERANAAAIERGLTLSAVALEAAAELGLTTALNGVLARGKAWACAKSYAPTR
jgi:hypothetical protein